MRCDVSSPGESARCGDGDRPCHRQRHHLRLDSFLCFLGFIFGDNIYIYFSLSSSCMTLASCSSTDQP